MSQNYQNGLSSYSVNRNYVNCPTCGRSIEMSELAADAQATQAAIAKLPADVQDSINNQLLPIRPCKICQSQMQQSLQGQYRCG